MADVSVILELLRQAQQERNKPSPVAEGVAGAQGIMSSIMQGIQMYDALKTLGGKYGTTQTTPGVPGQAVTTPGVPSFAESNPLRSALMPGATNIPLPDFTAGSTLAGGKSAPFPVPQVDSGLTSALSQILQSPGIPGQTTVTPAIPEKRTVIPGSFDVARIKEAAEVSPSLGRQVAGNLGVDMGKTIKEQQLEQGTLAVTGYDASGQPILNWLPGKTVRNIAKKDDVGGNIISANTETGETRVIGTKKKGDVVLKDTDSKGKTEEDKINVQLKSIEDDAINAATKLSSDFGVFDKKKFDVNFPEQYKKLVNQRLSSLPQSKRSELITNRFSQPIDTSENFRKQNSAFIDKAKLRVKQSRVSGSFNEAEARAELKKYGIPEEVITEIILAQ